MVNPITAQFAPSNENCLVLYQPLLPGRFVSFGSTFPKQPPKFTVAEPLENENVYYDSCGHLDRPHHKGLLVDSFF